MKRKSFRKLLLPASLSVLIGVMLAGLPGVADAQTNVGPGFTYQGYVEENGNPVNGTCNFAFRLFDSLAGGNQLGVTQSVSGVTVTEGRYTVTLNEGNEFGDDAFNGQARWLGIDVDCGNGHTTLGRQELLAVPYALGLRPGAIINGNLPSQPVLDIHQMAPSGPDTYGLRIRSSNPQIALVNPSDTGLPLFDITWKLGRPPDADDTVDSASFSIATETIADARTRLLINSGGDVGIGTTTPGERLTVRDGDHQIGIVDANTGKEWTFTTLDGVDGGTFPNRFAIAEDGGPRRLVIAAGGNVGIGTDNPQGKLEITSPNFNDHLVLNRSDVGPMHVTATDPRGLAITDGTDNPFVQVLQATGNVGIGTANPNHKLVVQGNDPTLQIRDGTTNNSANAARLELLERAGGSFNGGAFLQWNGQTDKLHIGTELNGNDTDDVLVVDRATSNVGIGTTNPQNRLSVRDENHQIALIDENIGKTWTLSTADHERGFGVYEDGSSQSPRLFITAGGNVGIGTVSPNHELVVQGDDPALQIRDDTTNDSANAARFELLERAGGDFDGGAFFWWNGQTDKLLIGTKEDGDNTNVLVVDRATNSVGIGTQNPDNYRLAVNGPIRAREIVVETGWSDFVFEEDYELMSLAKVEAYIAEYGHLPDVPSAAEVASQGLRVGETEAKLLQKIEELTLHLIALDKQVQTLEQENARLNEALEPLRALPPEMKGE